MYQAISNLHGVVGQFLTYRDYIKGIRDYIKVVSEYANVSHNDSLSVIKVRWDFPDCVTEVVTVKYLD